MDANLVIHTKITNEFTFQPNDRISRNLAQQYYNRQNLRWPQDSQALNTNAHYYCEEIFEEVLN